MGGSLQSHVMGKIHPREGEPSSLRHDVPLAELTTFELGGPARHLVHARGEDEVREALDWAARECLAVAVLGGGSNVVAADTGFDGLVLHMASRGVRARCAGPGEPVLVTAAAGESWDELVARAVAEGWAGLECLSGVPGTVGATPIQNVGAYGQDVAETIAKVRVLDRGAPEDRGASQEPVTREMAAAECRFSYRDSVFRREPDRFVLLEVTFALHRGGPPAVRYPELARSLGRTSVAPSLAEVRAAVLELRRSKSMVREDSDPNRRSAGSFFVNPVVSSYEAAAVAERARKAGMIAAPEAMPSFPSGTDSVKLSAAWLIERAGFGRGTVRGHVGISSRHTLALVHHGGGTSAELVELAGEVRRGVFELFGVWLRPEPVFLGFATPDPVSAG